MKTLQQVTQEITYLAKDLKVATDAHETKTAKGIQAHIDQLRFFKLYLETNPKPETVVKMRDDTLKRISILESRFGMWSAGKSEANSVLWARYNSLMGIAELKHKLKALNYLCE